MNESIASSVMAGACVTPPETDGNGRVRAVLRFPPGFPAFAGHFPGNPVLPAVAQLAAVRQVAGAHLGHPLVPVGVERAKFMTVIGPDEETVFLLRIIENGDRIAISFTITTGGGKAATGDLVCRPA
ncbi:MAG: hypothetical protein Kow0089_05630 [Desulfobulbaceae bacterium]